jgi:hypothetical protein
MAFDELGHFIDDHGFKQEITTLANVVNKLVILDSTIESFDG